MYDAKGNPIQYAAKERPVSGYMKIYKNVAPYESESSFIYDGGTIINRAVTQIAVRKVWKGMDEGEKRTLLGVFRSQGRGSICFANLHPFHDCTLLH